mmetsp:Transcript_18997/g.34300  ORF Transcript_18997/g.34300 Transcript_18997/m.34300 type:complete len:80 (+) Transcript_18997:94-333(+)
MLFHKYSLGKSCVDFLQSSCIHRWSLFRAPPGRKFWTFGKEILDFPLGAPEPPARGAASSGPNSSPRSNFSRFGFKVVL